MGGWGSVFILMLNVLGMIYLLNQAFEISKLDQIHLNLLSYTASQDTTSGHYDHF